MLCVVVLDANALHGYVTLVALLAALCVTACCCRGPKLTDGLKKSDD